MTGLFFSNENKFTIKRKRKEESESFNLTNIKLNRAIESMSSHLYYAV